MYYHHDHEVYEMLLLVAVALAFLSSAFCIGHGLYTDLAYKTVRVLRDRWFARVEYTISGKTVMVFSIDHADFLLAKSYVHWCHHYGRTAELLRELASICFRWAFWILLLALVFCC